MADVIPRPIHGDVVELILDDHRLLEELLRRLRDVIQDRAGLRRMVSTALHHQVRKLIKRAKKRSG